MNKSPNFGVVFDARRRFYPRSHVHAPGIDLGDSRGDILGGQPARQQDGGALGQAGRQRPIGLETGAAKFGGMVGVNQPGRRGGGRRIGLEQAFQARPFRRAAGP